MSDLICSPPICAALPDRALLRISGPPGDEAQAAGFLNPLISSDVAAEPGRAVYAALLTPQGKFLHDFLVYTQSPESGLGGSLLIDVAAERRADLKRRLTLYRLRAKVELTEMDDWQGYALFGSGQQPDVGQDAVLFTDPRLPALGWRLWLPVNVAPPFAITGLAAYEAHRIALGVPEGARDIEVDKGLLLENHFEALNGVDFRKGCYIGQELTARTKYRGLVKKQLYRVDGVAALPPAGTPITANGQEVGQLRSVSGSSGLALLRLDATSQELDAAGIALTATRPDYAGPVPEAKS